MAYSSLVYLIACFKEAATIHGGPPSLIGFCSIVMTKHCTTVMAQAALTQGFPEFRLLCRSHSVYSARTRRMDNVGKLLTYNYRGDG